MKHFQAVMVTQQRGVWVASSLRQPHLSRSPHLVWQLNIVRQTQQAASSFLIALLSQAQQAASSFFNGFGLWFSQSFLTPGCMAPEAECIGFH